MLYSQLVNLHYLQSVLEFTYMNKEKTILLIEDEPDIREAMAEAVASEDFKVLTAENGEIGLKMAIEQNPDLILLDLVMPVMDGRIMLKRLREDPWGKNAKVIILTSMDDVENVTLAYEDEIVGYIIKAHSSLEDIMRQIRLAVYTDDK